MSRRNGEGRAIHGDKLRRSDEDARSLIAAIEERFLIVCKLHGRATGGEKLPVPRWMRPHFVRWRQAVVRHKSGDLRHSESEWKSTKEVAQWTVDLHRELRGQEPKQVEWGD